MKLSRAFLVAVAAPLAVASLSHAQVTCNLNDDGAQRSKNAPKANFKWTYNVNPIVGDVFDEAAENWDDPECNRMGNDYPLFGPHIGVGSPSANSSWVGPQPPGASQATQYNFMFHYSDGSGPLIDGKYACATTSDTQITFYRQAGPGSEAPWCPAYAYFYHRQGANNDPGNPIYEPSKYRAILLWMALHEIGHWLGVGHSSQPGCVMYEGVQWSAAASPDGQIKLRQEDYQRADLRNDTPEEFKEECDANADCTATPKPNAGGHPQPETRPNFRPNPMDEWTGGVGGSQVGPSYQVIIVSWCASVFYQNQWYEICTTKEVGSI